MASMNRVFVVVAFLALSLVLVSVYWVDVNSLIGSMTTSEVQLAECPSCSPSTTQHTACPLQTQHTSCSSPPECPQCPQCATPTECVQCVPSLVSHFPVELANEATITISNIESIGCLNGIVPDASLTPMPLLGAIAFRRPDRVGRWYDSLDHPVEHIVVVQNGLVPEVSRAIFQLRERRPDRCDRFTFIFGAENRGVSWAWNQVLGARANDHHRWKFVISDDVTFRPGSMKNIVARVNHDLDDPASSNKCMIMPPCQFSKGHYWAFAYLMRCIDTIGTFDENIVLYGEDDDMQHRAARLGLIVDMIERAAAPEMEIIHGDNPHLGYVTGIQEEINNGFLAPILRRQCHESPHCYYAFKWGGPLHQERPGGTPYNSGWSWKDWMPVRGLRNCILHGDPTMLCSVQSLSKVQQTRY